MIYQMLSGFPPFWGENKTDIFKAILRNPLVFNKNEWSVISDEAKDLIEKMLIKDPHERISLQ